MQTETPSLPWDSRCRPNWRPRCCSPFLSWSEVAHDTPSRTQQHRKRGLPRRQGCAIAARHAAAAAAVALLPLQPPYCCCCPAAAGVQNGQHIGHHHKGQPPYRSCQATQTVSSRYHHPQPYFRMAKLEAYSANNPAVRGWHAIDLSFFWVVCMYGEASLPPDTTKSVPEIRAQSAVCRGDSFPRASERPARLSIERKEYGSRGSGPFVEISLHTFLHHPDTGPSHRVSEHLRAASAPHKISDKYLLDGNAQQQQRLRRARTSMIIYYVQLGQQSGYRLGQQSGRIGLNYTHEYRWWFLQL